MTASGSDIATTTPGQLLEERVATAADTGPAAGVMPSSRESPKLLRLSRIDADADAAGAGFEELAGPTVPLADETGFAPSSFVGPERFAREPRATRLWLPNTANVDAIWPGLVDGRQVPVTVVALDFPAYADGRAYSQARVLRRLGFAGELRATGAAVTSDQVHFMHRCGFDALELRPDQDVGACLSALQQFPEPYQTSADGAVPARLRRRQA